MNKNTVLFSQKCKLHDKLEELQSKFTENCIKGHLTCLQKNRHCEMASKIGGKILKLIKRLEKLKKTLDKEK